MAKKTVNSDIYNLAKLVDDVKSTYIPSENEDTLAISTFGYIGAVESNRLQTQVEMTGELCNEVFPSRARLERNVITHAIMNNIENINAIPAKMPVFLAIKESDLALYFAESSESPLSFIIDRECPIYIGNYEFHLEYSIKLLKIQITDNRLDSSSSNLSVTTNYAYTARYLIESNRDVPTSTITSANQYLSPPAVVNVDGESYIYVSTIISQVEHTSVTKKLVTSNIVDNKTINFNFQNQLAYFEICCKESDQEYYLTPVFEGSSVPESNAKYYCWYQYIDSDLIRVRFDRNSYMPGLNTTVECLIKTTQGDSGNFTYSGDIIMSLDSELYGYKNISCLVTPISESSGGKNRKSKKELQALIPKEALSRGSITTITDLNNYFGMIDSEFGRIVIQKKIDNQIERVYYAYLVAKDTNQNIIPSNTLDVKIDIDHMIKSQIYETDSYPRYLLPAGSCFRLGDDGIAYLNNLPLIETGEELVLKPVQLGLPVQLEFDVIVTDASYSAVSCGVDLNDASTNTHVFPKDGDDRYSMIISSKDSEVYDFLQMGVGQKYTYTTEYITSTDNSIIRAYGASVPCLDFVQAFYTANGVTKFFDNKDQINAYGLPANTKVIFGLTYRLNTKAKGIISFTYKNNTVYKLNQTNTCKLSYILEACGFEGTVTNAVSSNPAAVSLVENGTITPYDPEPAGNKYKLHVVTEDELPPIDQREGNEWYYVIQSSEEREEEEEQNAVSADEEKDYELIVTTPEDMPPISEREENQWFYTVTEAEEQETTTELVGDDETDAEYKLSVEKQKDMPPIESREENNWWYAIQSATERGEYNPGKLFGKEYDLTGIGDFQSTPVTITVTIDDIDYTIIVTQDRHAVENTLTILESNVIMKSARYTTYAPTIDQNKWPDMLFVKDIIHYKVRYRSSSNDYSPTVTIKLSKGLEYYADSRIKIAYPDGTIVYYDPTKIPLNEEGEFIYTNPYAICINSNRLYSTFYMMALTENPYLHFNFVNDYSSIQFISTNVRWNRPFSESGTSVKNNYTINGLFTQSVQSDLLLAPNESSTPMVKAILVFKKNGEPYRYKSLTLDTMADTYNTYAFSFSQSFRSKDIFDTNNNLQITNMQVAGQREYTIQIEQQDSTSGKSVTLVNGSKMDLSDILDSLDITLSSEVARISVTGNEKEDYYKPDIDTELVSGDTRNLGVIVEPITNDSYKFTLVAMNDFADYLDITLYSKDNTKLAVLKAFVSSGPSVFTLHLGDSFDKLCNIETYVLASEILTKYGITDAIIQKVQCNVDYYNIGLVPIKSSTSVEDTKIYFYGDIAEIKETAALTIYYTQNNEAKTFVCPISSTAVEYGFFDTNVEAKIYTLCKLNVGTSRTEALENRDDIEAISPDFAEWTVTNSYDIVNGLTTYHNYSEIMGSRCEPYGEDSTGTELTLLNPEGYYVRGVPLLGYEYCQNEILAQAAISALNYRKAYLEAAETLLENSFGLDFKLFNTYGPSRTYYIINDKDNNGLLDEGIEYIDRVNLTFYFRIKMAYSKDSYTKDNIIKEIKAYIEDLNDIGDLHIPNLITQITNNYKEQISYFEYLGFNDYGPNIQHIYKELDDVIPIHVAPEFLNINNAINSNKTTSPDINIYVSDI